MILILVVGTTGGKRIDGRCPHGRNAERVGNDQAVEATGDDELRGSDILDDRQAVAIRGDQFSSARQFQLRSDCHVLVIGDQDNGAFDGGPRVEQQAGKDTGIAKRASEVPPPAAVRSPRTA